MAVKIFAFIALILVSASPVFGADMEIVCDGGGCSSSNNNALFSSTDIWSPGHNQTRMVRVVNRGGDNLTIVNRATNSVSEGGLDEVLGITISRFGDGRQLYTDKFSEFFTAGNIPLSILGPGASDEFIYQVAMVPEAGNEYQNKTSTFDLELIFDGGHGDSTTSSDGGQTSSAGPSCDQASPAKAPDNLRIDNQSPNSIRLAWDSVSPLTHYGLIFTRIRDGAKYGSPNIGGGNLYTVRNLNGNEEYEFEVFGVNGCSPGPAAKVRSVIVGGTISGEPLGENDEVLGIKTDEKPVAGGILGTDDNICFEPWWKAIYILTTLALGIIAARKVTRKRWFAAAISLFAVGLLVDANFFCQHNHWYLLLPLTGLVKRRRSSVS